MNPRHPMSTQFPGRHSPLHESLHVGYGQNGGYEPKKLELGKSLTHLIHGMVPRCIEDVRLFPILLPNRAESLSQRWRFLQSEKFLPCKHPSKLSCPLSNPRCCADFTHKFYEPSQSTMLLWSSTRSRCEGINISTSAKDCVPRSTHHLLCVA
jgi:hypothetical protein